MWFYQSRLFFVTLQVSWPFCSVALWCHTTLILICHLWRRLQYNKFFAQQLLWQVQININSNIYYYVVFWRKTINYYLIVFIQSDIYLNGFECIRTSHKYNVGRFLCFHSSSKKLLCSVRQYYQYVGVGRFHHLLQIPLLFQVFIN